MTTWGKLARVAMDALDIPQTARGVESDVYRTLVTSPRCQLCGSDAAMVAHPGGDIWYCPTCGDGDYISEVE